MLESGITLIHDGTFYYRGHDAVKLAETASVEDVAALLWERRDAEARAALRRSRVRSTRAQLAQLARVATDVALARCRRRCRSPAPATSRRYDLRPAAVRATGARIMRLLTIDRRRRRRARADPRALQAGVGAETSLRSPT